MRFSTIFAAATALPLMLAAGTALALDAPKGASATLKDAAGNTAGTVTLMDMGDHLMGKIDATGLKPGAHGIHIHMVGACTAPDFASAGGHLNPTGKKHGLDNPDGAHQGDLPQLVAGDDGKASASFTAHSTMAAVMDSDGSAFVVHADADDQKTDPSGNSGSRILCGVFTKG